ncbi:MAG TPA: right-handed parallel beta-helix repeat-containing protein, partial [Candidatus Acidoferrum sp.]|nr:right-handed parallel beta-helix repeat-containing protein [Candidatus Acidoferrum sp.]
NVPAANLTEGSTMYLSYWVYYPSNQTSSSDPTMLKIADDSSYELRMRLYAQSATNLANEISLYVPVWSSWLIPARHSLSSGTWHKIYIEDYLHSSSGSFKLYVDNLLWLNINGIKTVTAGGKMNEISFYNEEHPITYYVDDFRFGKLPFDARGAVYTNDYKFLDIGNFRFQGTDGAVISANSTDIDLHDSIFNALSNDAIENYGSANIALFYNTLFGSGRYGLYSSTNASLTDSVIYNSTANDVFIDAGASLTGSYNWFEDPAKGGTGTYIDAGSTTWSGADPAFAGSAAGDFHLLSASPLIDAGTPIAGFASDFEGTSRPQGLAPDIGAYEFSPLETFTPSATFTASRTFTVTYTP